ncbi:MAG: ABC transporter ATP-binding protein [Magnetococcales bacterium]|nr:ABC transporter ATP-binding protein [Magnetococcales bacterium]
MTTDPTAQDAPADAAAPTPAPPIVEVRGLRARYGERWVLKGVDLAVQPGEIRAIMGGSGSGKTTLLRHLLGLARPESGSVRIFGKEIHHLNARDLYALRRRMGVAFQGGALMSSMTVSENLMFPLVEHTTLDRATMEIMVRMKLEAVNLSHAGHLLPSELSGGMLKRAAMARAMIMDPPLLFCDEPSAGLDPMVASQLDDLLLQWREVWGVTIIVVTHELASVFKIADRVTILDQGEILFTGTLEEMRASPLVRVQNLLHRRTEEKPQDPAAYLHRLTSGWGQS